MQSLAKFLASPQTLHLGEVNATGKSRIANLSGKGGKPIRVLLAKGCTLRTPFQCKSFDGTSDRCSLDLCMTDELSKFADFIDTAVLALVKESPAAYFKKPPADVASIYQSVRRTASKPEYSDTLRTKITLGAKPSCKIWGPDKNLLTCEDVGELDWPSSRLAVGVQISGVWFLAASSGAMINVCQLMVQPGDVSCPFGTSDDDSDEG